MGTCNSTQTNSSSKRANASKHLPKQNQTNSITTDKHSSSTTCTSIPTNYILPPSLCKYSDITKDYKILSELGSGISGTVCEAESMSNEKVAIKRINKSNIKFKDCVIKEAELNKLLSHPNIIKCYDIYEDTISFVLELGEGGDLFDFIVNSPNGCVPLDLSIDLIEQILETITYLHVTKGIVHRDLKPENFMISIDKNNKPLVKLIDFGFATYIPKDKNSLLTECVGTPAYSASEIAVHDDYDEKVDIWAIGVIMFNMLTGLEPFQGNSHSNLNYEIKYKKIRYDAITDEKMRNFVSRFLDRNAKTRISAKDALKVIKQIKQDNNDLLNGKQLINENNNDKDTPMKQKELDYFMYGLKDNDNIMNALLKM